MKKAPVALFIFNRPENVMKVMESIRAYAPDHLLIIADGPRPDKENEKELCENTRNAALNINWDCKVQTLFSDVNLGCKQRIVSGLDWVFGKFEEAIILEDDCVPDESFFPYVSELLNRFRHDEQIGMISGNNYLFGKLTFDESYYFSRYPHIWGWATWRRAWKKYDAEMNYWRSLTTDEKVNWLKSRFETSGEQKHWFYSFQRVAEFHLDTWDFQWVFAMFNNQMLSIAPKENLIANIGIDSNATHTKKPTLESSAPRGRLEFPLVHDGLIQSRKGMLADSIESKLLYRRNLIGRIRRKSVTLARLLSQK